MAKQRLSVLGIKVRMGKHDPNRSDPLTFRFFIEKGSPADPMFFTNPSLRMELEKHGLKEGWVGDHQYWSNGEVEAYPFERAAKGGKFVTFGPTGAGRGLERITSREAEKIFGKVNLMPRLLASKSRANHMKKLGVKVKEVRPKEFDFAVPIKDLRRRLNETRNRYRREHRLTPADSLARAMERGMRIRARRPRL
ncbi:MAG TPA: hypothetical protein HA254_03650 [Candidatus Diapherotrites archaeon]|uniref:Uncharacterized protein n=1 Tax=Candidatus Iainarchaeum sp. TaxID=3101447 RepID=A0A7J4IW44_9ARCH|nr:hypothetical protein [Candidatus Diapherotrites archaeon]